MVILLSHTHPLHGDSFLVKRLGSRELLTTEVARALNSLEVSLFHTLLAKLSCQETITSSQDQLFERCVDIVDKPSRISVLPHRRILSSSAQASSKWVLKLNGCISNPKDLMLTRDDFAKSQLDRTALSGVLQALLITKHMAFIGVSFEDAQVSAY
jgi:hypothetical protein